MAFVYILKSLTFGKYYIGSTNNFKRRFIQHNAGREKSTKWLKPFKLILVQEYRTLSEARIIENKLKMFKSRKIIEKIIKEGVIKMTA